MGSMLRQWRERLTAGDAGFADSSARRTPGLRREELAQLAGISVDYVTKLEQGRFTTPTAQVLEALARALRLSADERRLLFALGQRVPRQDRMRTDLTPSVRRLLEQSPSPMCVYDAAWTPLSWNRSFAALFGDPGVHRGLEANLIYRYATGMPTRVRRTEAEGSAYLRAYVGDLRATYSRFPDDPRVIRLVSALTSRSAEFAAMWVDQPVDVLHETHKRVEHPSLGTVELDCDILTVDGTDLRIVLFTTAPGTTHADALALLNSLEVVPAEA